MPKFEVSMRRETVEHLTITVEAEDAGEAEDFAEAEAESGDYDWKTKSFSDIEVFSVTEKTPTGLTMPKPTTTTTTATTTTYCMAYLSACKTCAIASTGEIFTVGERVGHQGDTDSAVILGFEIDAENVDIKVYTDKGHCTINFLVKLPPSSVNR